MTWNENCLNYGQKGTNNKYTIGFKTTLEKLTFEFYQCPICRFEWNKLL